jgi:rhodanese-related sulfurtransferase
MIKATLNNITQEEEFVQAIKDDPEAIILDVRTPEEFEGDHLQSAVNFNYLSRTLSDDIETLNPEKSYYVYCKTGRRSLRVCTLLKNSGFKKVYNLDQGLSDEDS